MTVSARVHVQVALIALAVIALAIAGWIMAPLKATTWLIAIASMTVVWLVVAGIGALRPFAEHSASERNFLVASVGAAGVIFVLSLSYALSKALGFDGGEIFERGLGVATGLILLVLGNAMPKVLGPLTAKRCVPATAQSLQRFSGWVFVLAGLAYAGAYIALPLSVARDWATTPVFVALVIVALRVIWAVRRTSSASSSELG